MFMLQIIASVLDVFGLASLVPIVMLASEPGSVQQSKWAGWLYRSLDWVQPKLSHCQPCA